MKMKTPILCVLIAVLLLFQSCTVYQKQASALPKDPSLKDRYKVFTRKGKIYRGVQLSSQGNLITGIHYRTEKELFSLTKREIDKTFLWDKKSSKIATALVIITGVGLLAGGIWYATWDPFGPGWN